MPAARAAAMSVSRSPMRKLRARSLDRPSEKGGFYERTAPRWRLVSEKGDWGRRPSARWTAPGKAGRRRGPSAQRTQPSAQGLDPGEARVAERASRVDHDDRPARTLVRERLAAGATLLARLWTSAWAMSGR